ncbi:hypothetical protein CY35_17G001100 [Sphagnum magellanicum]|nr:hypothetical protein CY35_17G001100 [Sphagnum magellanicum]
MWSIADVSYHRRGRYGSDLASAILVCRSNFHSCSASPPPGAPPPSDFFRALPSLLPFFNPVSMNSQVQWSKRVCVHVRSRRLLVLCWKQQSLPSFSLAIEMMQGLDCGSIREELLQPFLVK